MSEDEYYCWYCGKLTKLVYEPNERVFCEECKTKHLKEHKENVLNYAKLKIDVMYENALRTMEKAGVYMYEYQNSAKKIYEDAKTDTEKFFSSYEMITAIILDEFGYEYEINKKILKYRTDFYIPELKVCLEIDGERHNHREVYDNRRDLEIRNYLGLDWEIIRIPTKYLNQNPVRLIDAVEELKKEKKRIRNKNKGVIPEWYSKREKEHYRKITPDREVTTFRPFY